jgi:hypothetical protein
MHSNSNYIESIEIVRRRYPPRDTNFPHWIDCQGGFRVTLTPDMRHSIYNHTPRSFTNCFSWPLLTPRENGGKKKTIRKHA